jgi:hypothetical protein
VAVERVPLPVEGEAGLRLECRAEVGVACVQLVGEFDELADVAPVFGVDFANARVEPGSILSADEVAHWDLLAGSFDLKRVNHSEAYSENGVHTNLAESYFSRLRRMIRGQHQAVSGKYLGAYAVHAAWLEDHSKESNGVLAERLIFDALAAPVSRAWSGYWQRRAA